MTFVKKTSLVILIALALVSGASAYAYTEGVFDDVIDLIEQDEEVVEGTIQEEPTIIESELAALISLSTNFGTNFYSMEEVDDGDNNEVEEIVWDNFTFQFDASESVGNIEIILGTLEMEIRLVEWMEATVTNYLANT